MDSFNRRKLVNQLVKGLICFVFAALSISAKAQFTPTIVVQPAVLSLDGIVTNGGIATIQTTVTSLSSLSLSWYCNGQLVPSSKVVTANVPLVGIVSTITLTGVSAANAGKYYFCATNAVGHVTSSNATLVVQSVVGTVTGTTSNVVNFVTDATTGLTTNGFKIRLSGPTGSNVVIEASADLSHWYPISTNTFASGAVSFTDTDAKNHTFRYYRTKM
jgi:hypothetical protein